METDGLPWFQIGDRSFPCVVRGAWVGLLVAPAAVWANASMGAVCLLRCARVTFSEPDPVEVAVLASSSTELNRISGIPARFEAFGEAFWLNVAEDAAGSSMEPLKRILNLKRRRGR